MHISKLEEWVKFADIPYQELNDTGRNLYEEITNFIDTNLDIDELYENDYSQSDVWEQIIGLFETKENYNFNCKATQLWYDYGR